MLIKRREEKLKSFWFFNFILSSTATTTKTNNDNSQKIKCLCFLISFFSALKNDLFSFMIDNQ